MKLVLLITLALADGPVVEAPEESVVAQAVQMNEQLSEILARVEELKSIQATDSTTESEPAKRVEPPPPQK
jgi:hypothetical protein